MPDLPGDVDEPYDRRFVKWMIRNKVGRARPGPLWVLLEAEPQSSPASAISPSTGVHLCLEFAKRCCAGWQASLGSQGLGRLICTVRSWRLNPKLIRL